MGRSSLWPVWSKVASTLCVRTQVGKARALVQPGDHKGRRGVSHGGVTRYEECKGSAGSCSLPPMLNGDEVRILNEANLHGVSQNGTCFTYQRFHSLGSARAEAWCHSSINQEASAAPVGISARAEHGVRRREIYSKHFARTGSLVLAGIENPPRFETMSERIHHGDSSTSAPHPQLLHPSLPAVCQKSLFFPPPVPFPSRVSSGVLLRVPLKAHSRGLAPITAFTTPRSVHQG